MSLKPLLGRWRLRYVTTDLLSYVRSETVVRTRLVYEGVLHVMDRVARKCPEDVAELVGDVEDALYVHLLWEPFYQLGVMLRFDPLNPYLTK